MLLPMLFMSNNSNDRNKISDHRQELVIAAAAFAPFFSNKRLGGGVARLAVASVAAISFSATATVGTASSLPLSLPGQFESQGQEQEQKAPFLPAETLDGGDEGGLFESKTLSSATLFNEIESQNSQMATGFGGGLNNDNNSSNNYDDFDSSNNGGSNNTTNSQEAATWSLLLSALFYKFDSFDVNWSNFILAIILVMLMLTTAVGNLFVIVAILIERNLRTIGNYLVLSLAIADLLVACLVMPLAGIYQILERWTLGVLLCDIWTSADVFCCTASILHLLAIALDRYWAVTRVDYIRCQRNERRILFMIFLVWFAACIISLAPVFGWKDAQFEWRITNDQECLISQDIGYQIFATCTTFYFPLTLTLIFYWKIYQVARKRIRRKPGNRVKISLQHPSSSSSATLPGTKLQQQQQLRIQQQQQQRPKQPTCQSIAGNPRTGEPGNREQVVSSVQKQIAMAGEIDPQHSLCPCSCHIQHPHFQMEAKNSPPITSNSKSNGNAPNTPLRALARAQNSPSSLSNKGELSSSSEKTYFEQYAVDVVVDDEIQQQQPKLQRDKTTLGEEENAAHVVSETTTTNKTTTTNNDDCQATTMPPNRLKFNVDYQICANNNGDNLSTGQSNEEQTVVSCLDGLNEVKTTPPTTATSNSGSSSSCSATKMTEQKRRNLAGVNVGMKPEADIRTRDSFNDQDNNEPIDIDPNVRNSSVINHNYNNNSNNNNCSECPGCEQKLDASKAGSNNNTNNKNNITSERESLMSQQLNGSSTATTATTTTHEDGTSRDHHQQHQRQQGQSSKGHLCNLNGVISSFEERQEGDSSSHSSLVNCDMLDDVQKNITSTSLMGRNNKDKEQGYCLASGANQAKHFQCTEMLEDCCGCCCDEQQQQLQQQEQKQPEHQILKNQAEVCKLTSNPLNDVVDCNSTTSMAINDRDEQNESKKKFATNMMVSLDIGGGRGREADRVVSELVAPLEKEYDDDEVKKACLGNKQQQQNHKHKHVNNLLKIIQESQLALYWRQIRSQLYRRRHESGLNSTEPDTSTDREIGHAILVDETGQGTLVNVCKSCNCTMIQTNNNNNNNNNLDDRSTIIKLGDGTTTTTTTTTKLLLDDEANLNNTTPSLNIAESTANIAVSTVNPPINNKSTIISIAATTKTSPNSVPQHSQVIATNLTTTKTVTTTTTTTTTTTNTTEGIESKRERKAAKTLAIITGVFVMCWLPFFVMAITMPLLNLKPHKYVFALMLWLGYVNSMLNPIIYTIFSPDFRKAFKRLLCAMDDSNEIRRRKRMRGAGGFGTSTSQLQTTYGRSTLVGSNAGGGGGGGGGYGHSNSLSSDNSQQNKSCNTMKDNNNYNKNRFFDFKCLSEQYQSHLNNLCNNLPLISRFCCSSCCCSSNLSPTSSNFSHDQENNNNYNSTSREQSLRRIAIKNNSGRQQTNEDNNNSLSGQQRQGHLKNLRNNVNNALNDTELDNYKNNNNNQEVSDNNKDKHLDNNQLVEPDRCSPMRRLYLQEQREQEQQQQGTITTNRPAITKNDF